MRRVPPTDRRRDPKRPPRLDLLDVDGLAAIQHRQVPGLAAVTYEPFQEREGLIPKVHLLKNQPTELEDPQPEPISRRSAIALDEARRLEIHEKAMDRGLMQAETVCEVGHTEFRVLRAECVQD